MKKNFKFYSDSGHGWLAVKRKLLKEMGIEHQITRCSYMKGETVYLEEDLDATTFIAVYEQKYGMKPEITCINVNDRSPIRSYASYYFVA